MKIENCKIDNSSKIPRILLVDMNSFFASVEQQANPMLRGKPIGVCASLHETSCLIAASKEAKALGIKTGILTYKAKKICPEIVLLQAEPDKYREVNRQMVKIFCDYTDRVEVYSIDEAFLEMSQCHPEAGGRRICSRGQILRSAQNDIKNTLQIAAEIKKRIKQEVGEWLTCSIGIASNKFMAKLAADMQKPDGLSLLWREQLPLIYKTKKFRDLWGIAGGWEKRLARLGIISPLQLLDYPVQNLMSLFGKSGFYLWQRVNGLEEDIISPPFLGQSDETSPSPSLKGGEYPKSFGHSWVLNFRTTDKDRLRPVILRLAEKAARRMRADGFEAYGVCLSLTLVDGTHFSQSRKLKYSVDTGMGLYYEALKMWESWKFEKEVMHIAVRFMKLVERTCQLSLFDNPSQPPLMLRGGEIIPPLKIRGGQGELLTEALDQINDKYGEFVVRSGLLAQTDFFTPDAIAFAR